ncbi:hypothetical protein [Hoeflea sp.]|uniref:hypothetical protein n=1 Tax=Hoeflea sp. TaxID=1940281 RepID=UPI003A8F96C7
MLPVEFELTYSITGLRSCADEIERSGLPPAKAQKLVSMLTLTAASLVDLQGRMQEIPMMPKSHRGRIEETSGNVVRVAFR